MQQTAYGVLLSHSIQLAGESYLWPPISPASVKDGFIDNSSGKPINVSTITLID